MKIGIVGTHGIGKTTLAYALATYLKRLGLNAKVINEVVRRCPFPLNDGFTINGGIWTICEQVRRELDAVIEGSAVTVCDRSALDPIFYLKSRGIDHNEFAELEQFAISWLNSYERLIWVLPSEEMPLLEDGVRSVAPDFQRVIHEYFSEFFAQYPSFSYVAISSEDVFRNKLDQMVKALNLEALAPVGG